VMMMMMMMMMMMNYHHSIQCQPQVSSLKSVMPRRADEFQLYPPGDFVVYEENR